MTASVTPAEDSRARLRRVWARYIRHTDVEPALQTAFLQHATHLTVRGMLLFCVAVEVLLLLSWPTDFWAFHGDQRLMDLNAMWRTFTLFSCGFFAVWASLAGERAGRGLVLSVVGLGSLAQFGVLGYSAGSMGGFDSPFFYPIYVLGTFTVAAVYIPLLARLAFNTLLAATFVVGFTWNHPAYWQYPWVASSFIVLAAAVVIPSVLGHMVYHLSRRNFLQARELEEAHAAAESLLLNILPAPIAQRLKRSRDPIADAFPEVTVLFADIAGFTPMSAQLEPRELVSLLNLVFSDFDRIAGKHGLEKIKTIGDAYMVAGGLPQPRKDHADSVAEMALEMVDVMGRYHRPDGTPLSMRIGINSGPVVAGVIGTRKFIYDLWGDAVNTASRMESHGAAGRICVSKSTRDLLGDRYEFDDRGEVEIKGKGPMQLYFLMRKKT